MGGGGGGGGGGGRGGARAPGGGPYTKVQDLMEAPKSVSGEIFWPHRSEILALPSPTELHVVSFRFSFDKFS
jgi:hypothetical protein